jgi:putative flippase GtrA
VLLGVDVQAAQRRVLACGARVGVDAATARQILRFAIVGCVTFLAYLTVMRVCVLNLHIHPGLAAAAAWSAGTLVSYVGNARWSFEARITRYNFIRFIAVALLGLGANVAIAWVLSVGGVHYASISLIIFVIVPWLNFISHKMISFGRAA